MNPLRRLPEIASPDGRFTLRPFARGDSDALVRHINSSQIAKRVTNIPNPYTSEHARSWFERLDEASEKFGYSHRIDFAIAVDNEVVGSIAFINIDGHKAQISYWLGEEFQGAGIMTGAVRLAVRFGQDVCGFKRIWGYTWGNNIVSQKVLEKAGFVREGVHRKEWFKEGAYHDSIMFAIVT